MPSEIEQHLLDHFNSKPPAKKTCIFKTSDIYIASQGRPMSKKISSQRRILGKWLYDRMKTHPAHVKGFDISIHTATTPYRYIAIRTE